MNIQQLAEWGFQTFIENPFFVFGFGIMIVSQVVKSFVKVAPGKAMIIPMILSAGLAVIFLFGGMFDWYAAIYNGFLYFLVAIAGYEILHNWKLTAGIFKSKFELTGGANRRGKK